MLSGAEHYHWYMHEPIVLRSSGEAIEAATIALGNPQLTRQSKTRDIHAFIRFVLDYPAPFNGDFLGLARRSLEWHRQNQILPEGERMHAETVLPLLNLDYSYLSEEGVSPLRTVGDVVEEGQVMHHCVGSYARRAHEGYSFLFHVEHNGEWATIELDRAGRVQQAYGPHNTINSACRWGSEVLGRAVGETTINVIEAIPF